MVWVVLVVLVLSNILLTLYLYKELNKKLDKNLTKLFNSIEAIKLRRDYNAVNILNAIKTLPKEITVKNVLNIP